MQHMYNSVGKSMVTEIHDLFWPTSRAGIEGQCREQRGLHLKGYLYFIWLETPSPEDLTLCGRIFFLYQYYFF